MPNQVKPMQTLLETSSADLVRTLHTAGHEIVLTHKGPRRWTYQTSASQAECLAAARLLRENPTVQAIPGGTPGYR